MNDDTALSSETKRRKIGNTAFVVVGVVAAIIPLVVCVSLVIFANLGPGSEQVPTKGTPATAPPTRTPKPTWTPLPTPTRVPTPKGLPTGAALGDTWVRPADSMVMVYVPGGTFTMGAAEEDPDAQRDESPAHEVTLHGFWIDQTEVTNGQYALCVEAGMCPEPFDAELKQFKSYYGSPAYDDHPVVYVAWFQAQAYCGWASAQLLSEAQWEYAARGPESWIYPWGNTPPNDSRANYGQKVDLPSAAGSYPQGASWCGALDMAGNVWEWTADWFAVYSEEAQIDPVGPSRGIGHMVRGGSFYDEASFIRSSNRYLLGESRRDYHAPTGHGFNVGFRCSVRP